MSTVAIVPFSSLLLKKYCLKKVYVFIKSIVFVRVYVFGRFEELMICCACASNYETGFGFEKTKRI
mgnify:CR=1 FL=1